MNKQVTAYINESSASQKKILQELRLIINQSIPGVEENFKWGRPVFSTSKDIIYFKTARAYISLGFFHAGKIKTHTNLLEGTGKDMRHIKIRNAEEIDKSLLKSWFKDVAS